MFVFSLKLKRTGVVAAAVIMILSVVCTALFASAAAKPSQAAEDMSSNAHRIAFLKACGWEVSAEPVEIVEVTIPAVFDTVYEEYNKLQLKQNFDLSKLMGKRVKRYSYEVLNYENGEKDIQADLLILNNKLVGGDVMSRRIDGFIIPLLKQTS